MSERSDREFLGDIREAIQRITNYTRGMSYEDFLSDAKTQDAVIRNLEVLGEAAKNLSEEFRVAHASLPWKSMMGTRDRLIHHYFGVSLDIVWQIVSLELPKVGSQLQKLAEDEGPSSQTP